MEVKIFRWKLSPPWLLLIYHQTMSFCVCPQDLLRQVHLFSALVVNPINNTHPSGGTGAMNVEKCLSFIVHFVTTVASRKHTWRNMLKEGMFMRRNPLWRQTIIISHQFCEDQYVERWLSSHQDCGGSESKYPTQAHQCDTCSRVYSHHQSLRNHQKFECGKTPQFACPICQYRCKRKGNLKSHMRHVHAKTLPC